MNKLETNALRIAELMGYDRVDSKTFKKDNEYWFEEQLGIKYSSYDYLMPIVFESNNTDYEIHLYSSCVQLNTDEILIFDYNTEPKFIEALQLACIKYLELKDEN